MYNWAYGLKETKDRDIFAPRATLMYIKLGGYALKNNDFAVATRFAILAYTRGLEFLQPNSDKRFSKRARSSGIAKAKKLDEVKNKVIQLLKELAPEEGWRNKTYATETVSDELRKKEYSCMLKRSGLGDDSLKDTIDDWIRANPKKYPLRAANATWT